MQPIILCTSCGSNIGAVLAIFYRLKLAVVRDFRDTQRPNFGVSATSDSEPAATEIHYGEIMRELGYENQCCYAIAVAIRLFHDFGTGIPSVLSSDKRPFVGSE